MDCSENATDFSVDIGCFHIHPLADASLAERLLPLDRVGT